MNNKKGKKSVKNRLVNSIRDGCIAVDTWVNPNNKVFYIVHVGYKDPMSSKWINQKVSILDNDIPNLMCQLRKARLFPKKSYEQLTLFD